MLRRLLALALAALALLGSAGCADDVSPALRIGDQKISNDDLLSEVDEWAKSPTLLAQLQLPVSEGASPGTYPQALVGFVMSSRVSFQLHNDQFDALDLDLTDDDVAMVRSGLFSDPSITDAVFRELGADFADRLVADVARQFLVSQAMSEEYQAWQLEAYTDTTVEVNPRYGAWDPTTGQVIPPTGPRQPDAPELQL